MKNWGPVSLLLVGLALCLLGYVAAQGPVDHNIGRSIANSVIQKGYIIIGAIVSFCGLVWLLLRLGGRGGPPPHA